MNIVVNYYTSITVNWVRNKNDKLSKDIHCFCGRNLRFVLMRLLRNEKNTKKLLIKQKTFQRIIIYSL